MQKTAVLMRTPEVARLGAGLLVHGEAPSMSNGIFRRRLLDRVCGRLSDILVTPPEPRREERCEILETRLLLSGEAGSIEVTLHALASTSPFFLPLESLRSVSTETPAVLASACTPFGIALSGLKANLLGAAMEFTADAASNPLRLSLPRPDGTMGEFWIAEAPIMEPGLAAQFPDIKTYRGQGIDDPTASLRMDYTPLGFHAQVLSAQGSYYIDPYYLNDADGPYVSYYKRDLTSADTWQCDDASDVTLGTVSVDALPADYEPLALTYGSTLRTFRAAVAADGEYVAKVGGGTVSGGQAAVVTAVNRVTGVYETELDVRLVLVANNSSIIYTNASTDPYTNTNASALLSQNQSNLDSVIGTANYDIGHVFTTGGGGLASLGVVGRNGSKARGETGLSNPIGDAYYIDYVAHEMGHQFGGNHTFNTANDTANRNGSTAYEPGSGSTIMAYAGIEGADDLQPHSDPYFHSASIDEIRSYLSSIPTVGTSSSTGNSAPTVSAGSGYVIPAHTPFVLTASGSDLNGDVVTYDWQERDLGVATNLTTPDNGSSPILRDWAPTTSRSRTIPRLSDLVNNTLAPGEMLPAVSRGSFNWRVIARDNRAGGGGVSSSDVSLSVVDTGAAFAVTSPNTAVSWPAGSLQVVSWDVAGTLTNGINTAYVRILLSTDGGLTYPIVLSPSTANIGAQLITLPDITTTTARVRVEAVGNIFFDISDTNFTIAAANDNFASRTDLGSVASTTATGTNVGGTGETGEPAQSGAINSSWWSWTAPANGVATIDTNGSGFDTLLTLASGSAVNSLSVLQQNDDVVSGTHWSQITQAVTAGTQYQMAVDGYGASTGTIMLNLAFAAVNDNFANRTDLGSVSGSWTGHNLGGTGETGEPAQSGVINSSWWSWTAPADGVATIDTNGTELDTFLTLSTGSAVNSLTVLQQNDDMMPGIYWSRVTQVVSAGAQYQIAVDGYDGDTGFITLNLAFAAINDNFADRIGLGSVLAGTWTGSNLGATGEAGEPAQSGVINSSWWSWTAPAGGVATIDTNGSSLDTYLLLATGSSVGSLTTVDYDDDSGTGTCSRITPVVIAGTQYQIAVDGFSGNTGLITLNLSFAAVSDNFTNRTSLGSVISGTWTGTNLGGTGENGEPSQSGPLNSSWWSWTAPADGVATFDTNGSAFDTILTLATGSVVSSLTVLQQNDDVSTGNWSRVAQTVSAGTQYQVAVDGYNSGTGAITLNLSFAPTNDNFANRIDLGSVTTGAWTGTDLGGTGEAGEPAQSGAINSSWWSWTAPAAGTLSVNTNGSSLDTYLTIATGTAVSGLTVVAQDDDSGAGTCSLINSRVVAGMEYQIAVDGFGSSTGAISLNLFFQPNTAPTNLALSATSVAENQPSGTVVGNFSTTDSDIGDTFTYSLVAGTGSSDNSGFTISGSQLKTAGSFNFEAKNSYSIRIRSTDQGGLWFEKAFTISVLNVAEVTPTITGISNDTGSSSSDGITSDKTLLINGTAEPGMSISVYRGGTLAGTTAADGSGNWSFDYTGTSLADGSYSFTATASDALGHTTAASAAYGVRVDTAAPAAPSVTINSGAIQRSMVKEIDLAFTEAVDVSGDALALLLHTGGVPGGTVLNVSNPSGDKRNYHLTFAGTAIIGGSLADGIYDLIIRAAGVQDLAGNQLGADSTKTFHRLFGDADGNKTVTAMEALAYKNAVGTRSGTANYVSYFDYDGNGTITAMEYLFFKSRVGVRYVYT